MTWLTFLVQFKSLIDWIFESVHSERRQSPPLSLSALPVQSIIRTRSNGRCHFHCLTGNSTVILSTA